MKKFKLEPVLTYRQILENQAQQKLAQALDREAALISEITRQEEELQALYAERDKRQQSGMAIHEMQLYENRISHQVQSLAEMVEQLDRLSRQVVASREALCDASRDKKLLEKVKEKHRMQQQAEMRRRESNLLDEVAVLFNTRGEP